MIKQKNGQQMTWMQTATGKKFSFSNPKPEDIELLDISTALSTMVRFNGHIKEYYTVADHSVNLALLIQENFKSFFPQDKLDIMMLEALMHDAAEAYTGDIISPLKFFLRKELKPIEGKINEAIAKKFNLTYPYSRIVYEYDRLICGIEAFKLLHNPPIDSFHIELCPHHRLLQRELKFGYDYFEFTKEILDRVNGRISTKKD
jgi:uncharacterized protein